jgi:hypothetical protein
MNADRRDRSDAKPDEDVPVEDLYQLSGTPAPQDQDVIVEPDEVEEAREYTETELDELLPQTVDGPLDGLEDLAAGELRPGETDDPTVATEEGLAYVPPTDPPVVPGEGDVDLEIAAGFGTTSRDEPYDEDHAATLLSDEDELSARVREAIRADAATTQYADDIDIESAGGVVLLRGVVEDIEDTDSLAEVASAVDGVSEVRDELTVAGL